MLALNNNSRSTRSCSREDEEEDKKAGADSFAERAEVYYRKRPQLLALLQDLYNGYLSLADRYCQILAKAKHHHQHSSQTTAAHFEGKVDCYCEEEEEEENDDQDSDAESSLSCQPPPVINLKYPTALLGLEYSEGDAIVTELVMKMVDYDILENEMGMVELRWSESWRKIELQKSLLEVLESERLILLNENAKLGYRVTGLLEENKGLVAETSFMKRKAGELARCLLNMREDHRVCMLSRKIEDLQGQIYSLETRNKEYYEQLVKRDNHLQLSHHQPAIGPQAAAGKHKLKKTKSKKKGKGKKAGEVSLEDCFQVDEDDTDVGTKKKCTDDHAAAGGGGRGRKVS